MEIDEWHPPTEPRMPVTPEAFPSSGVNSLASLGARAVARILDLLLLVIPYSVLALFVYVVAGGDAASTAETMEPTVRDRMVLTAPFLALAVLYETVTITLWGQTLGKFALGVRVARQVNGRCPLWWESALRIGLPAVVAVIPHPIAISAAMALFVTAGFDPLRRNLTDRAAGTVVVRSR